MVCNMIKKFLLLTIAVFVCSTTWPAAPAILVVGDSLSAGYGIANEQTWVSLLEHRLQQNGYPHKVINASVSGDTTAQGLVKLPAALRRHQPEIVIIELGGNDGLRALDTDMIRQNLAQMIQLGLDAGAKVLLAGTKLPPNYGPAYVSAFEHIYSNLAQEYQLALVPFLMEGVAANGALMQEDGIHPNAKGHQKMLDTVWAQLEKLLAGKTAVGPLGANPCPSPSRRQTMVPGTNNFADSQSGRKAVTNQNQQPVKLRRARKAV